MQDTSTEEHKDFCFFLGKRCTYTNKCKHFPYIMKYNVKGLLLNVCLTNSIFIKKLTHDEIY